MISVEIPTILRTYTGGERAVTAEGDTLGAVIENLETAYPGIGDRLVEAGALRRFVNVYLNDEDVRFLDGLAAEVSDGDTVTILPAVAGGAPAAAVG
ncbi:MAG: MoaD/ThiS family protein [Candidatus Nanopelagicales bacterium]